MLGRTRAHPRRADERLLRRPRARRGRLLRLPPGRLGRTARRACRRARGARPRRAVRQARARRAGRRRVRGGDPRGDRPRAAPPRRPERGVVGRRRGRADPAARAVRDRLGRAADARGRCPRPRARASFGRCQDRGRPGGVHHPTAAGGAAARGGGRRRPGLARRRRPAALSPAGDDRGGARRRRQPTRVHGDGDQLPRERPGRLDDPEPDDRQPGDAPAPCGTPVRDPPVLEAGRARVPDAPGHGFEIDLDAVAGAHERWERDGPYSTLEVR